MKSKKKKLSFKRIMKNLKRELKALWERIVKTPKTTKIIAGIWFGVILVIVILIITGNSNKKFIEQYQSIENSADKAMLKYVSENEYDGTVDAPIKMPIELLVDYGVDASLIEKYDCTGFSLSYTNEEDGSYEISSYISCKDYVTKGYTANNK